MQYERINPNHKAPSHKRRRAHVRSVSWSRKTKIASGIMGALLVGGGAFAATNWTVGLASGSNANAQGAAIQNLTFSDFTSAPTETDQLFPSATAASPGSGDVTFKLTNPNPFPVTVSAITIPTETLTSNDAAGFTTSSLTTAITGCGATTSTVTWTSAPTTAGGKLENLTTGSGDFSVAANASITVTLTNDAAMDSTAPFVCAGTSSGTAPNLTYAGAYFVMPSLVGITATGGTFSGQAAIVANGGSVTTGY